MRNEAEVSSLASKSVGGVGVVKRQVTEKKGLRKKGRHQSLWLIRSRQKKILSMKA